MKKEWKEERRNLILLITRRIKWGRNNGNE
jgi:hypothetical protein